MRKRRADDVRPPCGCRAVAQGLQLTGFVDSFGSEQRGPSLVSGSGRLIIANGPALCSPLKGVVFLGSTPQPTTSAMLLNQNPRWNVLVGAKPTSASNPKI